MTTIPTVEPKQIQAGDLLQWTKDFSDYPAGTWALSYTLLNSTNKITINGSASGTTHLISVPAATTAGYAPGTYAYQGYVTNGSVRHKVSEGNVEILPNFATQTTLDTRTHAKKTLEAIEAVLEGRASLDQQEYTIQGRSLKRMPIEDLLKFRDKYRSEVRAEEAADRLASGIAGKNRILVRF